MPLNDRKYELKPASAEEAGIFYALPPEKDAELGCIGHVRIDFGRHGDQFYHTWHQRGSEELNSQEFKDELTEVVNELRESVLKDFSGMKDFCSSHGGEISGGWTQNYGYIVETENYRYCLRCNPLPGDYQAYLTCFDKGVQKMNQANLHSNNDHTEGSRDLKITDHFGHLITVRPRLGLYTVTDFLGEELPGLAVLLDEVGDSSETLEPYAVLTTSLGEFISIKNSAYIDTNNCHFTDELLTQGIAEATGLTKTSGYCSYPLWIFNEDFLRDIGGEIYEEYSQAYDLYMGFFEDEDYDMTEEEGQVEGSWPEMEEM